MRAGFISSQGRGPLTLTEAGARLFPIICDGLETFVTAFAAVKRDGGRAAASRDDDKRLCEPLACPTPAPLEEGAPQCASRGDRHRRHVGPACRRCRRRHSLCPRIADGWSRRGVSERFLLARLQSRIACPSGSEASRRSSRTGPRSLLVVTVRCRGSDLAEMARRCADAKWRDLPESKGHGPPEL